MSDDRERERVQNEADQRAVTQTLVLASDTFVFGLTCWLIALTSQACVKAAAAPAGGARAGHIIASVFLGVGASALLCVSSRLFQTHYKDHGPSLFEYK